jgi:hypothetical protein
MQTSITRILASLSVAALVGCSSGSGGSSTADAGSAVRPDAGGGDAGGGAAVGGDAGVAADCTAIVTCIGACARGDQACAQACVSKGSAAAQGQFAALSNCIAQKCASAQTDAAIQQCLSTQCSAEVSACQGGGSGTCPQLNQCFASCAQGDQACFQGCARQASPAAVQAYQAVATCAQQNGCTNPQTQQQCLQQNCAAQLQTCINN